MAKKPIPNSPQASNLIILTHFLILNLKIHSGWNHTVEEKINLDCKMKQCGPAGPGISRAGLPLERTGPGPGRDEHILPQAYPFCQLGRAKLGGLCFLSFFGLSIYYLAKTIKTTSKTCLVQAGRGFSLSTTLFKLTRLLKGPKFKVGP